MRRRRGLGRCSIVLLLWVVLALGVAACGSNEGDDDNPFDIQTESPGEPVVNRSPVADAGEDRTVLVDTAVALDGSGSFDPEDDHLLFAWEMLQRPAGSGAVLEAAEAVRPVFVPDLPGDYILQLVVSDGSLPSPPDLVVISAAAEVPNAPPVAIIATRSSAVHSLSLVELDAGASFDPDGDVLFYEWTLLEQPDTAFTQLTPADAATTSFIPPVSGDYTVRLLVRDIHGAVASDFLLLTAVPPATNINPVAIVSPVLSAEVNQLVTLDGSASFDPDGTFVLYDWEFFNRPRDSFAVLSATSTATPFFVPDRPGEYWITLTLRDPAGATSTATSVITVVPAGANLPPVADAGPDRLVPVGVSVVLNGIGSFDPEDQGLDFFWSLFPPAGSRAVLGGADTATAVFTADLIGTYRLELTVRDPFGAVARDAVLIVAR